MDVEPEDQERSRELLELLHDVVVAIARRDDLVLPAGEGMRAGGGNREPHALGRVRELAPVAEDLVAQLADVAADPGADFDDRRVHLALDLVAEHRPAGRQELRHMRPQRAALRIDDLEFLLDTQGEWRHEGMILQSTVGSRRSTV